MAWGWTTGTTGSMSDSPGGTDLIWTNGFPNSGLANYERTADFQTYIMFNPGGELDAWVPVREVKWGFSAKVIPVEQAEGSALPRYQVSPAPTAYVQSVFDIAAHPDWNLNIAFSDYNIMGMDGMVLE